MTSWTVAHQAPLSIRLCRQEYWSASLFPSPGDLPNPGIKPASPVSPTLQADSLPAGGHQGSQLLSMFNMLALGEVNFYLTLVKEVQSIRRI